jgi:putative spermidine/putrescine transport system permease protein
MNGRTIGLRCLLAITILAPYLLLVVMSLGSGWTYPRLLPDRMDFAPWRRLAAERQGLAQSLVTSLTLSVTVGTLATATGLLAGRAVRRRSTLLGRWLLYLPFAASPVVLGVTLYDLLVRLQLAGTYSGVVVVQTLFATAMATVFFSTSWTPRSDQLEHLVRSLGGRRWQVWRHAIWPQAQGLAIVCFVQAALYSWIDYGLVAIVGGGQVQTVTMRLFAYVREANVNQAAIASLVLVGPAVAGCLLSGLTRSASSDRLAVRSLFRDV